MSDEALSSQLTESTQAIFDLVRDSLNGYAEMARDFYQRSRDPATEVDLLEEVSRWCERTVSDGARLFLSLEQMLENLAASPGTPTSPAPDPPPSSNCIKITVGPVSSGSGATPASLRRRGDPQPTIPASNVIVKTNRADPTLLDLEVEAGGYPRGLYEGSLGVAGGLSLAFNIYVDW